METDYTIDTVGRFCPVPIIETANKIKQMNAGETLTVISDDEGIKTDMPSWCAMTGNEFLGMSESGGEIRVYVRKASPEGSIRPEACT
jgi:tRNA 2-thiouridine synthesizing protein A